MTLEINRTWGANNPAINPDVTLNTYPSDITTVGWSPVNSGGGGDGVAPVISGAADNIVDYEITSGTGRSAFTKSVPIEAGKIYYLIAELVSLTGDPINTNNFGLIDTVNSTNRVPNQSIQATSPGFWGVRFEGVDDNGAFVVGCRFGLGIISALQNGPATAQWRNIAVIEVESVNSPPPLFNYLEFQDNSVQVGAVPRDLINLSSFNESTGEITYLEGDSLPGLQRYSNILNVTDSYGGDGNEYVAKLAELDGNVAIRGSANSGQKTAVLLSKCDDVIALTDLPYNGPIHTAMICQASVNDFNTVSPTDGDAVLVSVGQMIDKANAAGLLAFCPNIPKVGIITAGARTTEWLKFQSGLESLCVAKNAVFVDVSGPLTATGDPLAYIEAANENVDTIHLSGDGYAIYAGALLESLTLARTGAERPALTAPYDERSDSLGDAVNITSNFTGATRYRAQDLPDGCSISSITGAVTGTVKSLIAGVPTVIAVNANGHTLGAIPWTVQDPARSAVTVAAGVVKFDNVTIATDSAVYLSPFGLLTATQNNGNVGTVDGSGSDLIINGTTITSPAVLYLSPAGVLTDQPNGDAVANFN